MKEPIQYEKTIGTMQMTVRNIDPQMETALKLILTKECERICKGITIEYS